MEDNFGLWFAKSVSSNIPYLNLLLLNTGQAVVAVFLSSEFLKRDKKLDTSEVFYVRPLSNAEYVVGKIWGNLRVFLFLNLLVLDETDFANHRPKLSSINIMAKLKNPKNTTASRVKIRKKQLLTNILLSYLATDRMFMINDIGK